MSDVVIRAEGLGKKYLIGHETERERDPTLRDLLARTVTGFARSAGDMMRGRQLLAGDRIEEFWALKDVSFEIKRGDVVGIIGSNGAGKSTLLKILSRITEPSAGRVEIRGRVASLLEVGTGFHPELTGRENIYLNGAILGMSRAEIRRKFDEIVAFAEVERFLDTPVKRYSSGMYVRLAFAVAAHLEPEILIVDEVLAVGDAEFQKRCLGKMSEVAGHGRTVLFVSHNMGAVTTLCKRGFALKGGSIYFDGKADACVEKYLTTGRELQQDNIIRLPRSKSEKFYVDRIEILDNEGKALSRAKTWDLVIFRVVFHSPAATKAGAVVVQLSSTGGTPIFNLSSEYNSICVPYQIGLNSVDCFVPKLPLSAGVYQIGCALYIPNAEIFYKNWEAGILEIGARDVYNCGSAPYSDAGLVTLDQNWSYSDYSAQ